MNVSALNEPQKIGLTTEKKTGSRRTEKRKRAVPLEWKGKKIATKYRTCIQKL
jgi:hypothetical protein